jgi:hypothetical protein
MIYEKKYLLRISQIQKSFESVHFNAKSYLILYLQIPKLYIPSTINSWKKVLTKAIWADKKLAGFWQIRLYIK